MDKEEGVCMCGKNEILPFLTTWLDPEDVMLSETSLTEKDKYHPILLIHRL